MSELYLKHYQKALEVFKDPLFSQQDLLLHDFKDEIYRSVKGYTDHGIHWGYVDDLVACINNLPKDGYYAYILTDKFKNKSNYTSYYLSNTRYSIVKFKYIKKAVLIIMEEKIASAKEEEEEYLAKMKTKVEINIPLSFDNKDFLFIRFNDNYADEFDVEGFKVFTTQEWEEWKSSIKKKSLNYGFGTNEGIEYSSKEEFLERFEVKEITREQAIALFQLFGKQTTKFLDWNGRDFDKKVTLTEVNFGKFPNFDYDEDEDDDEDCI